MPKSLKIALLVLLSACVYFYFGYVLNRSFFYEILLGFSIAFGAYVILVKQAHFADLKVYQFIGIAFRLIFLCSIPSLSDDYYRFIWDGQLIVQGINPFDYLPTEVSIDFSNKATLLAGMNSQEYYTIYPPIAQLIYWLAASFSPNSILGSIIGIRVFILLAEIGIILLLPKLLKLLNQNPLNSLWYILNPLVIVELTGNLHFEAIMIFFLFAALYLIIQNKVKVSPVLWALSAATKLIPLVFLPVLFRKYNIKQLIWIYSLALAFFIVLWLPFYSENLIPHFLKSFNLYFKSFEFNASLYYIIRWIGFQFAGYNVIAWSGEIMPKAALFIMLILMLRKGNITWIKMLESLLFAISIYYLFAFIVHPWYICMVLVIGVFTPYKFAVLWSFLAVLSYWAYQTNNYVENFYLIAFEYTMIIAYFIIEFYKKKQFPTVYLKSES